MFNIKKEKIIHDNLEKQRQELMNLENEEVCELAISNANADRLENSRGDFGHFYKNPILTNGNYGTLIYLGKILNDKTKSFILFHKIGSIENTLSNVGFIDIYEILDETGTCWDILFIDMYHPRRSNLIPNGYVFLEYDKEIGDINRAMGTTRKCKNFPFDLTTHLISDFNKKNKEVTEIFNKWQKEGVKIERPEEHAKKIKAIEEILENLYNV